MARLTCSIVTTWQNVKGKGPGAGFLNLHREHNDLGDEHLSACSFYLCHAAEHYLHYRLVT